MSSTVAERRQERTTEIVSAAWKLARQVGLAGVTLRALAREVGMRQPSLYEYFDSKNALYDRMFADGNRQLVERLEGVELPGDRRSALKTLLQAFAQFTLEDPVRGELLFERHIPGFEPSPDSYAVAESALGRVVAVMQEAGVRDQGDIDCVVAVTAGLLHAQSANEPGGSRWVRHLDRMIDLVVDDVERRSTP